MGNNFSNQSCTCNLKSNTSVLESQSVTAKKSNRRVTKSESSSSFVVSNSFGGSTKNSKYTDTKLLTDTVRGRARMRSLSGGTGKVVSLTLCNAGQDQVLGNFQGIKRDEQKPSCGPPIVQVDRKSKLLASTSSSHSLRLEVTTPPTMLKKSDRKEKKKGSSTREETDLHRMLANLSLRGNNVEGGYKTEREWKTDESVENKEIELPMNVLYYGWFFSPEASTVINKVVMDLFRECICQVSQFERFILTCCKDADVKDVFEYYKKPGKKLKSDEDLKYHITAKFMGRLPDIPYQTMVHSLINQSFRISLIGLVFTPRSLGVRVKLSTAQQLIFDEKETEIKAKGYNEAKIETSRQQHIVIRQVKDELESYSKKDKLHKTQNPNCKMKPDSNSGITYRRLGKTLGPISACDQSNLVVDPKLLTTSRAHITIGCAPTVAAKQTGDDLIDIIDLEQRPASNSANFQQDFKMKQGVLRQFGRHANAFVLYPNFEMIAPANFNFFI